MIKIKKLPEARWPEYRAIRLEALQQDPIAFGSAYEEEVEKSEADWKRRLPDCFFAFSGDRVVGMVVSVHERHLKIKHIANIFGVYVTPEFREKGVGKQLIAHTLEEIQKHPDVVKIQLNVNAEQRAAIKVYASHGFTLEPPRVEPVDPSKNKVFFWPRQGDTLHDAPSPHGQSLTETLIKIMIPEGARGPLVRGWSDGWKRICSSTAPYYDELVMVKFLKRV